MGPRIDILGGSILVVIALAALFEIGGLDRGSLRSFGPGMLPTVLATVLLGCGVGMLVVAWRENGPTVERFRMTWRGPTLISLAVLVFALTLEGMDEPWLVVPQFGLAIVGPVTVILAGHGSGSGATRDLAAVGFGLTAFCLALFNDALEMDIPVVPGLVETWMIDTLGTATTLRSVYGLWFLVMIALVATRPPPAPARKAAE